MNQYPGFVPMMMPQHFMVAMPGMPLQGIQTPHPGIPQMIPPGVAVAHAGGMAPVSTTMAQGIPLAAARQAPPGLNALAALPDQRQFVDARANHGFPGLAVPAMPVEDIVEEEPPIPAESITVLDEFNSDLNLVIDSEGYGAHTLNQPSGFCFTWSGVRASHGICKGKGFFEVHITEHLPVDFGDDHNETDPHIIRVGWSIDSSSFQLGEEPWSYGYGGTGKFSTNNKFSNYGEKFEVGDVIGAMLDLDDRPAKISYMKNGRYLGVAIPLHSYPVGNKDMALFPHILSKNCRFQVNLGQIDPWFPPPAMYQYIGQTTDKVRGMKEPEKISDCEMIMIVGLPGAGKTTWGLNMYKNHPEKRYNIIGTDTLIEKMRVMGLPRKRNYHGRWEVLINKASQCLNKLFTIAGKRKRNYILDQTNVYPSARRKKMRNFNGFYRIAAVLQPDDAELLRRSHKRTVEDGKIVPEEAVLEMKANFTLPEDRDNLFDRIDFVELNKDQIVTLVQQYNKEGQEKRPPREAVFRHDSRNQHNFRSGDSHPPRNHSPRQGQGRYQDQQHQGYDSGRQDRGYQSRGGYQRGFESNEPPSKRTKQESGSALDFIKEYGGGEEDPTAQAAAVAAAAAAAAAGVAAGAWADKLPVKEELKWNPGQYSWSQQQYGDSRRTPALPQQDFNQMFPPSGDQQRQNSAGTPEGRGGGGSQRWPPFGSDVQQNWQNREQADRKPWQQSSDDQYSQESNNAQDSARGSGNGRGFGNQQNAPGGFGGQQSSLGSHQSGYGSQQGGYGGQQESRNYSNQESRQFGQNESRKFGHQESKNFGQQNSRNFSQQGQSGLDRNYGQSGHSGGYGGSSFGRQQEGSSDNFGSQQRMGGFGGPPSYGGPGSGDRDRDRDRDNRSDHSPYNRGNSAESRRDSGRENYNQFTGPPPPPPQEPERDRFERGQAFRPDDFSSDKAATGLKPYDAAGSRSKDGSKTGANGERVRRRKSKWDTPSTDPPSNPDTPSLIEMSDILSAEVKLEPGCDRSDQQQYSEEKIEQNFNNLSSANDSPDKFAQVDFNRPPPNSSWRNSQNEQDQVQNQSSNFERGRPNMRGDNISSSNQYRSDNHYGGEAQSRGYPSNQHGGPGSHGNPGVRPPFEPRHQQGGSRGGNRGPPLNFGQGGPRSFRPRNPQDFGGPPGGWNQNRPRFGPRGPGTRPPFNPRFGPDGGQRFPRPPGQPRFQRP
ncbi:hornerin-like [Haliotis cracherodii]|uniref:hornerin-like n=1 Tax=Haliotis cracherodii TaxID=6455 RepID=UPI0039E8D87F